MMSLEKFVVLVYCLVDDLYRATVGEVRLRARGPTPRLHDVEVLTMELVGEFLGHHQDEKIWVYFCRHWRAWFPGLGDRSSFVKQAAALWRIKQLLRARLAGILGSFNDRHHLVDGIPMEVCVLGRAKRLQSFRGLTATSVCAAKKTRYHGFKGHLLVTADGLITDFTLTAANVDERRAALDLTDGVFGWWFGDKGYISAFFKSLLKEDSIQLDTPARKNMEDTCAPEERSVRMRVRRLIETVIGQLTERFELGVVRARRVMQLTARVERKLLAHTIAFAINRMFGRDPLDFDGILAQ
ncbi:MAG: IS982 family transposase [Deltaproteobacteria bacterium]|nr:IS982 family transposase [Deltaproteobacteria bacterium]